MNEKKEHLPVYGIGPALCYPMALLSAIGIWLSVKGIIPGRIDNKFVRNPCYCLFLLGSTGALLIAHNPLLLVLPPLFYVWMTLIIKSTEERWLTDLYGDEYREYCRRVNRCIPWFPR